MAEAASSDCHLVALYAPTEQHWLPAVDLLTSNQENSAHFILVSGCIYWVGDTFI